MLIISIGSWGARTVMLTYQEMGHVLIPNEPLFTPPPPVPPTGGEAWFFIIGEKQYLCRTPAASDRQDCHRTPVAN